MSIDPGIKAIFGDPPPGLDLKEQLVVTHNVSGAIVLGLAVAAVALRFYVRTTLKGSKLWYDDYAICVSVVWCGVMVFMTAIAGAHGAGEHVWASTLPRFVTLLKIVYSEPFLYAATVTSSKISILLLYRRLFHGQSSAGLSRLYNIMYWTAVFLTSVYPIILWVTMAAACRPVSFYWNQYLGAKGSCINVSLFFLLLGIVNMLNDVVILIVPIPRIWELQMNKRTKTSVMGIMLLGSFVCIASIVRIYYLNGLFENIDVTWWMGPSFAWSNLEPSVAVISACLPTFAPLFRMDRLKTSKSSNPYPSDRSGGGGGLSSSGAGGGGGGGLGRGNGGHERIEDDEVELTYNGTHGGTASSHGDEESKHSSDCDHGIVVKTQVSVTCQKKAEGSRM